jgi:HK97 family phage prohead protease
MERRNFDTTIEIRSNEGKNVIRGYAAMFGKKSDDLGGFIEIIEPGFFDGVLNDDVRALKNHDANLILGRTTSGTLRIGVDTNGLWYEYDDPETTYSKDLARSIERRDITQSSFAFTVAKEDWKEEAGVSIRILKKAGKLVDVSPVTYPAYPDTTVAKRHLDHYLTVHPTRDICNMDIEVMARQLNRLDAKYDLLRMERIAG